MNQDILEGKWKQLRGKAQQRWSQLTDSDLGRINSKRQELPGLLQAKYGFAKEKAEQEIDRFLKEIRIH
jgi:uncharacterized protein YjbJ (UPF0337 family)